MQIEFSAVASPRAWLRMVAGEFGTSVVDDGFTLPPHVGEGFFREYYPCPGLGVTISSIRTVQPLVLHRNALAQSPWLPLMFYTNETPLQQVVVGEQPHSVGRDLPEGIFCPSSDVESQWIFPPGIRHDNITLKFHRDWLLDQPSAQGSYMGKLLRSGHPFYLFEAIGPEMQQCLERLRAVHQGQETFAGLLIHALCVQLLHLFLSQVERRRDADTPYARLTRREVEAIFRVRAQLLEDPAHPPTIATLAGPAGMSASKLQKCFCQVFGLSMARYALQARMEWAKRLLAEGQLSVSEVGYRVGYSNLSKFTVAFRKHTGVNPKQWGRG